jgi:RNA polymerase sigma-70 factor (ECF subfamily)
MIALSDSELALMACRVEGLQREASTQAYGELVQRFQSAVFSVCYRLMGERAEAEDLAQDAFIRAYQHLDRFDPNLPFGPWVRRIAANLCINRLHARKELQMPLEDEVYDPPAPAEQNPEVVRIQGETAEAVWSAIGALPPAYRVVIELSHFEGLSYAEIAQALDLPLSDVKSHLFRARKRLAKLMRSYGTQSS